MPQLKNIRASDCSLLELLSAMCVSHKLVLQLSHVIGLLLLKQAKELFPEHLGQIWRVFVCDYQHALDISFSFPLL
jgi:hypothetical protein